MALSLPLCPHNVMQEAMSGDCADPCMGSHERSPTASNWQHPPSFYCPVSQQVMHDPVVLCDGHTYERRHIERWLQEHNTSPVSGLELPQRDLFKNHALRNAIEEYFQQVFSVHRRAIRKSITRTEAQENLGSNAAFVRTIDALMKSSLLMNADLSTENVLHQIMGEAKALVGAEAASVFLIDHARRQLYSTVNSLDQEIRIPLAAGIAGAVATTGDSEIITDAYNDARFNKKVDVKTGFRTRNIMCVPLKVKGEIIGVVQLVNKSDGGVLDTEEARAARSENSFTMDDLRFLQVFASQAALAIANSGALDEPPPRPEETTSEEEAGHCELDKGELVKPSLVARRDCSKEQDLRPSQETPDESPSCGLLSKAFDSWQFDAVALSEQTGRTPLSSLGAFLFDRLDLIESLGLDRAKLAAFLDEVELGYGETVPYHNRKHAASVMHMMHALLHSGGLSTVAAKAFEGIEKSRELGQMTCLLAAAIHDYQHKGLSNDFLVRAGDERALCYNDQHVNENHHVAAAFALLRRPDLNFLNEVSSEIFSRVRRLVIDLVLGTDMAESSKIMQSFNEALGRSDAAGAQGRYEPATAKEATLFLQIVMKCADLGHMALDWRPHVQWVRSLEQEFFSQGDQEKARGLSVSFLMDRAKPGPSQSQVGFFDNVVLPLFRMLTRAAPSTQPMLSSIMSNYKRWLDLEASGVEGIAEELDHATAGESFSSCYSSTSSSSSAALLQDIGTRSEPCAARQKRSGRARQRAAKFWSKIRCRTPSPDSMFQG